MAYYIRLSFRPMVHDRHLSILQSFN